MMTLLKMRRKLFILFLPIVISFISLFLFVIPSFADTTEYTLNSAGITVHLASDICSGDTYDVRTSNIHGAWQDTFTYSQAPYFSSFTRPIVGYAVQNGVTYTVHTACHTSGQQVLADVTFTPPNFTLPGGPTATPTPTPTPTPQTPTTIATLSKLDDEAPGFNYTNPTTVTLTADSAPGSTLGNTYYTIDGGPQQTYSSPFTVTGAGDHTITYWSVDTDGVQETPKQERFTISSAPYTLYYFDGTNTIVQVTTTSIGQCQSVYLNGSTNSNRNDFCSQNGNVFTFTFLNTNPNTIGFNSTQDGECSGNYMAVIFGPVSIGCFHNTNTYTPEAAPTTTANLTTQYADGTYTDPTTVTLSANAAAGYTIANTYYTIDGGSQQTYTTPFTITGAGSHTITYWSIDNAGVPETVKTKTFTITEAYNLAGTVYNDNNQNGIQDPGETGYAGATVTLNTNQTATTDSSGNYSFSNVEAGSYVETLTAPNGYTVTTPNPVTVALATNTTVNFGITHTAPATTASLSPSPFADGTYHDPTTVTLLATAEAGFSVANTYYTIDGGTQQTYTAPFTITGAGSHTISFWSVDNTGLAEATNSQTFTITEAYNLSGTVYVDANQNGVQDPGETGYADATVTLDSGQTTITDANGNYSFPTTESGSYSETLTVPAGYLATTTNPVNVALAADTTVNFGIALPTPTNTPTPTATPTPATTTLTPIADAYIKNGSQNENEGASTFLRIQSTGHNRALLKFDESQIQQAVGNSQNYTATLQLTITNNGNNWGANGRTIELHRLVQGWSEGNGFIDGNNPSNRGTGAGVTWNCATDTNIANQNDDCSGTTAWNMDNSSLWPFASAVTASTTIINNQTGTISFDVTSDVQSFINETNANDGWLIKKTDEGTAGEVAFGSKESSNSPVLIIHHN